MIGLIMLVVFVLYLLVAISVTRWLARIPKRSSYKWLMALLTLAVFALIPTWDEVLGRMYFKHLCETEGGVKVYKTVGLGPEYWEKDGTIKFVRGRVDELPRAGHFRMPVGKVGDRYLITDNVKRRYVQSFRIDKDWYAVVDRRTQEVMAERISFLYWGGWLINSSGLHVTATRCSGLETGLFADFLKHVFRNKV
ncbi:MAG: hypothetical protein ACRED0_10845 [Gammaproteobacteria bacterium]